MIDQPEEVPVRKGIHSEKELKSSLSGGSSKKTAESEFRHLLSAAGRARLAYDYEQAIELYSRALDLGTEAEQFDPLTEYDLRAARAACYKRLGNWKDELADLEAMTALGEEIDDVRRQVCAIALKVISAQSDVSKAQLYGEQILKLAREAGAEDLEAKGYTALAYAEDFSGDYLQAQEHLDEALERYRRFGDKAGQAYALGLLSRVTGSLGDHTRALIHAQAALALYRELGDQEGESTSLRLLGIYATDYAQRRSLTEEALALCEAIGDLPLQAVTQNNLGLQYARLGLYDTARTYLERAVQTQRKAQFMGGLAYTLESLGRIYFELGANDQAQACFEEGLQVAQERGFQAVQGFYWLGFGRLALARGQYEDALQAYEQAVDSFAKSDEPANLATAKAWQGAVHLELGDWGAAYRCTSEAVSGSKAVGDVSDEYPPQDVYWLHYRVLTASSIPQPLPSQWEEEEETPLSSGGREAGGEGEHASGLLRETDLRWAGGGGEPAWQTLHRAYELTMTNITTLSDAGLRRNHLNKIACNRQILLEYHKEAIARGIDLETPDLRSGNLQEQFKRLLVIGTRMNERREVDSLLDFIMDQLVELSGAERVLLVWVGENGGREVAAMRGFPEDDPAGALAVAEPVLDEMAKMQRPLLWQGAPSEQSVVQNSSSLSVMGTPLVSGGRLRGFIYEDNQVIFEPFTQEDLDLLASFANQSASALENTRLYQGLERRVAERTADLQQRNAELAVINSVQQGLAAELDMQAIYELVGDQIRDIFDAQVVIIFDLESETNLIYFNYMIEKGERFYPEPRPFGLLANRQIETRQPILLNTEESIESLGMETIDGTEPSKSLLSVPLIMGGVMRGGISLQNIDREYAFSDSDVRLLSTLASSMGVALENARLFAETQRLLEETEQRAAELSIINSVGEAMARQLDVDTVTRLVGDKVRDIFNSEAVMIMLHDRASDMLEFRYAYDKAEGGYVEANPFPFGSGISSKIIQSRQPLLYGTDKEGIQLGAITVRLKDKEPEQIERETESFMGVPIIIAEKVLGVISVQSYAQNAFDDNDLRLLSTLAANMGVAIENARLFEETQRLLEETKQRAAELSIINSVGEAMARQLDVETIARIVGDKVRDIFSAEVTQIHLFDAQANLVRAIYAYDRGYLQLDPHPMGRGLTSHIVETRAPLVLASLQESIALGAILQDNAAGDGEIVESYMGVPIIVADKVIGVVDVQSYRQNAFDEGNVRLLSTLATNMGVALENARLFDETNRLLEETRQQAAEMAIINSVGEAMAKQLDVETISRIVGDKVRDIFAAEVTSIYLFDAQARCINPIYEYDRGYVESEAFPHGQGLTSKLIESREPLVIGTHQQAETLGARFLENASGDQEYVESYMGVPIIVADRVIGAVDVQSYRQNAFDEGSVRLLSTLASNMGVAIENARLFDETKRRANEMAALTDIGREISATLDLPTVLDRIATNASELLAAETSAVILLEPDGQTLKPIAVVGENAEAIKAFSWQLGEGLIGSIAQSAQAERISDASRDPRAIHITGTDETEEVERLMVAPLHVREGVIGAMVVWRGGESNLFSQEELDFLIGMSRQAAIAIQNARLYNDAQRRAREMAALTEIGREISATLDLSTVLERIATRARDELDARDIVLRLLEPDGSLPTVVAIGKYAEIFKGDTLQLGQGITGSVAQSGVAEVVNYPLQDPRMVHVTGTEKDEDDEVLLFAPLISRETVIGVMALWRERSLHGPFSQNDLDFIVGLARQAAIAIENARLFDEIQRQKEYSEALVQNSPVAIVTTDLEGQVVSWNPGAEKLFGYKPEEAIAQNLDDLVAATEAMRTEAIAFNEQARQARFNLITHRARKDGSIVDVELSAVPVAVDGQPVGLIAIYHDITELQRAKQEAEAANEAKSAFLATMSHEIRTPMNAVIGMSGLLLDTELTTEQREFAEIIRRSGDDLLTIINDILDFSKIEAGRMELESQPFSLRECVEATLDLVAPRAFEKGLDLAYMIKDDTPAALTGDVTRLRQILLNLLTNAVKFTERGEVVLTVASAKVRGGSNAKYKLHFSVRDTGIGIPAERMDRLFQSFSQVDASTARRYGGTGLGLAISKRLSEMMDGTMWVESEGILDRGSTFHFTLQAEMVDLPETAQRELSVVQPQLEGKRVLIVDDNATNRRILVLQTQAWGMQPSQIEFPAEALKLIQQGEPFDVAILDMNMPDMDGLALAVEIRKLRDPEALPLILFTSLGRREAGVESVGFAAHLTKPIKPSQLYEALVGIFAGRPVQVGRTASDAIQIDRGLARRHPLRILLAEDNLVNQKLALRLLEQMGYRADLAGNGLEAIEALERQAYDVILMDVQMPEMDGLEASRQINRRWADDLRPRIIAMTANAMQGDRELCLAAGMDDYIAKPIRVEELVGALSKAEPIQERAGK